MKVCGFDLFVTLKLYRRVGPAERDKAGENGNMSQGFICVKDHLRLRKKKVLRSLRLSRGHLSSVSAVAEVNEIKDFHHSEITLLTYFNVPFPFPHPVLVAATRPEQR